MRPMSLSLPTARHRKCSWGSQSWLQAGFPAGLDALENASAGGIACPTSHPINQTDPLPFGSSLKPIEKPDNMRLKGEAC